MQCLRHAQRRAYGALRAALVRSHRERLVTLWACFAAVWVSYLLGLGTGYQMAPPDPFCAPPNSLCICPAAGGELYYSNDTEITVGSDDVRLHQPTDDVPAPMGAP